MVCLERKEGKQNPPQHTLNVNRKAVPYREWAVIFVSINTCANQKCKRKKLKFASRQTRWMCDWVCERQGRRLAHYTIMWKRQNGSKRRKSKSKPNQIEENENKNVHMWDWLEIGLPSVHKPAPAPVSSTAISLYSHCVILYVSTSTECLLPALCITCTYTHFGDVWAFALLTHVRDILKLRPKRIYKPRYLPDQRFQLPVVEVAVEEKRRRRRKRT